MNSRSRRARARTAAISPSTARRSSPPKGWDWIPAIRDRNSGIWQSVELAATGVLRVLDPQVITRLPLPRTDSADIIIRVPIENRGATAVHAGIDASFEGVRVHKDAVLDPGVTEVSLDPAEFIQLRVAHPRLWWPNGYGAPALYSLTLGVAADGAPSDARVIRFGIREITYELSLFDHNGKLRRVDVDPTAGSERHERLIDVRHEAIKRTANGWAESLTLAGETSPAVRDIDSTSLTPYLAIRVNGVPIAARGGSWGTDDLLKRIARERLEPYFKLHQAAHLNIIRNWLGQNTEEVFYDLADEYGLLVLNDFWASTQDFQVEIQDPQLFLDNARDVIRRYRNHPSIALWFARNEGVPQPVLNEGLADLVAQFDGTRYYTGSSNRVNLQDSGPYNYRPPEGYFTQLAQGFSVEVGSPSLSSIDALRASIPEADRWPLGDSYAYHDWHFGGNGDTASFMRTLQTSFGAATDLADFERKAQLMNYVSYRAIFEGFQAHLWTRKQRPPAVDDASRVAEQRVADLQLRLRHACRLLRGRQGLRAAACPDEPAGLPARGHQHHARGAGIAAAAQPRTVAGQSSAARASRSTRCSRQCHHDSRAAGPGAAAGQAGRSARGVDAHRQPQRGGLE